MLTAKFIPNCANVVAPFKSIPFKYHTLL